MATGTTLTTSPTTPRIPCPDPDSEPTPARHSVTPPEASLRGAAAAGDRAAFAALYITYRDSIYRYLARRCRGDRHLAEDLTQETFVRALSRLGGYRETGRPFGAWLVTIAGNLLNDHWRSGWHRYQLPCRDFTRDETGGRLGMPQESEGDPAAEVAASDWQRHVMRTLSSAIARLSRRQREVLSLRYAQGRSVADTARVLGLDEGAVKAATYRARQALASDPAIEELR